jgi:glycosyltransferase involved in cell wall biosynthesis
MKLKIAVIASMGKPPYLGGIENVVNTIINSQLNLIYSFQIFDTYRVPDVNRYTLNKIFYACRLSLSCCKFFRIYKPDIIHIHFCSNTDFYKHAICLIIARGLGFKTVFQLHGGNFEKNFNRYHLLAKKGVECIFRIPHRVIALSDYWAKFLNRVVNSERLTTINNPVSFDHYDIIGEKKKSSVQKIILLGRLGRHKGHYIALKALPLVLKKHPNVCLVFAGSDDSPGETAQLKKVAEELSVADNTVFLGPVTGGAKIKLLHTCSMMILPSYGENMPLSILEGMAAKLPVAASSVGAIPELFENGNIGILFEPGNHVALAEAIVKLLDDPGLANAMSLLGSKKARELYDIKRIAVQIDKLYQDVMFG